MSTGSSEWTSVGPELEHLSTNITDLNHGEQYELRVVGRNPLFQEGVASNIETYVVGYQKG